MSGLSNPRLRWHKSPSLAQISPLMALWGTWVSSRVSERFQPLLGRPKRFPPCGLSTGFGDLGEFSSTKTYTFGNPILYQNLHIRAESLYQNLHIYK